MVKITSQLWPSYPLLTKTILLNNTDEIIHWISCWYYTVANDTFVILDIHTTIAGHNHTPNTPYKMAISYYKWWHCKIAMLESSRERTKIASDIYINLNLKFIEIIPLHWSEEKALHNFIFYLCWHHQKRSRLPPSDWLLRQRRRDHHQPISSL